MTEAEQMADVVSNAIDIATAPLHKRISALETKMAQMAREPGMKYFGTHQRALPYGRNSCVTHQGSMWVVVVDQTREVPGTGSDWQLAVKRGTDGKDLR